MIPVRIQWQYWLPFGVFLAYLLKEHQRNTDTLYIWGMFLYLPYYLCQRYGKIRKVFLSFFWIYINIKITCNNNIVKFWQYLIFWLSDLLNRHEGAISNRADILWGNEYKLLAVFVYTAFALLIMDNVQNFIFLALKWKSRIQTVLNISCVQARLTQISYILLSL